ncbi:MAG: hypothetical protein ACOYD4_05005 [Solirubrobacterales bacterium]
MGTAELAIITTGAVGLGTPALSALFQARRESEAAARDQRAKDRDELRGLLDQTTAALHDRTERLTALESWMQRATFGLPKAKHAPKFEPDQRALLLTMEARLVIRRGRGDILVTALHEYLRLTDAALTEIDRRWNPDEEPFDYSDEQLADRALSYRQAFDHFVDRSKEVVA